MKFKEAWQDVIFGHENRARIVNEVIHKTEGVEQESASLIDEGDEEEEEVVT